MSLTKTAPRSLNVNKNLNPLIKETLEKINANRYGRLPIWWQENPPGEHAGYLEVRNLVYVMFK